MKKIKLTRNLFAIVDDDDYEYLSKYKWYALKNQYSYYAARKGKSVNYSIPKTIFMSHVVMKVPKDYVIRHINENTLDCRKQNLRINTHHQSLLGRKLNKNNSTGYKGVTLEKGKFRSRIVYNGRPIQLGYFEEAIDAAIAYNEKARELFGRFAKLNKISFSNGELDMTSKPKRKRAANSTPPEWLSRDEIRLWNKTLAQVKKLKVADMLLDNMDFDLLAAYCNAVVRYRKISRKKTMPLSNDDIEMLQGWSRIILSYADKLGFTPTSLARLKKKYHSKRIPPNTACT